MRMTCSVEGCESPRNARGYCGRHYMRWRTHGDPMVLSTRTSALETLRGLAAVETDECTLWPLGISNGYGSVYTGDLITTAHHLVCEWTHGPPPAGKPHAAHHCGVRACVNPRHIRWATPKENAADRLIHGTHNRGERCGSNRLTEEQVRRIRSIRGVSQRRIAEQFGVSEGAVHSIIIRKSWAWLQ